MCSSSMKGMTGVTRPYKKISVNMPKPTVMRMKAVLDRHWSPIGAELRTLLSDMFGDGPVGVARYGQEAPPTGHEKKTWISEVKSWRDAGDSGHLWGAECTLKGSQKRENMNGPKGECEAGSSSTACPSAMVGRSLRSEIAATHPSQSSYNMTSSRALCRRRAVIK